MQSRQIGTPVQLLVIIQYNPAIISCINSAVLVVVNYYSVIPLYVKLLGRSTGT